MIVREVCYSPPPPAAPPPPVKAAQAGDKGKAKDKGKHKVKEVNVESEVDRLIDSQDNVYVLSRPKCALPDRLRPSTLDGLACAIGTGALRATGQAHNKCSSQQPLHMPGRP